MLILALALFAAQDTELPAVAPGRCLAVATQMGLVLDTVRQRLRDDAKSDQPKYETGQRTRMMEMLEKDAQDTAATRSRYAKAQPNDDDRETAQTMNGGDLIRYVRVCLAA